MSDPIEVVEARFREIGRQKGIREACKMWNKIFDDNHFEEDAIYYWQEWVDEQLKEAAEVYDET